MSRRWRLLGLLLSAALVAHVFMLAGHHHDPVQHTSAAGVVAHGPGGSHAIAGPHAPAPTDDDRGAAAVAAGCLVVLAGAVLGFWLQSRFRAGTRALVWRRLLPPPVSPPVMRLLRPPRTPVVERVVLLT
jgi:hypothetical protein